MSWEVLNKNLLFFMIVVEPSGIDVGGNTIAFSLVFVDEALQIVVRRNVGREKTGWVPQSRCLLSQVRACLDDWSIHLNLK